MVAPSAARRQRWRDELQQVLAWVDEAHNIMKQKMIAAVGLLAMSAESDFDDPRDNLASLLAARRSHDAHTREIVEQFDQAEERLRVLLTDQPDQPDQHSQASQRPDQLAAAPQPRRSARLAAGACR